MLASLLQSGGDSSIKSKLEGFGGDPRVVVTSSINPRIVGGRLFLNATPETHAGEVLFNGKCLMIPMLLHPPSVTGIKMERGRCYVSCFMYTRKLQRTVISFTSVSRNNTKAIGWSGPGVNPEESQPLPFIQGDIQGSTRPKG
ncbi:hypothetical protein DY000_02060981 [Brassica cretica]|uniref:Uncharacterized protein n=1 Tax=Brassica cretica TaxID=69181 RepID=A0ABQ7B0Y5_BRACR|nr:hypothetical protein DY000_02060981 [Brassica cretica]